MTGFALGLFDRLVDDPGLKGGNLVRMTLGTGPAQVRAALGLRGGTTGRKGHEPQYEQAESRQ
jgi:hypothetical protein